MKRMISLVLVMALVLSLIACGAVGNGGAGFTPDSKDTEKAEESEKDSEKETEEEEASESAEPEPEVHEEAATKPGVWSMLDWANSNVQCRTEHMAFDENYIYFRLDDELYRCHYDGTEVEKLEDLKTLFPTEGTMWGLWADVSRAVEGEGVYTLNTETLERTLVEEQDDPDRSPMIFVSGDWLCSIGPNFEDVIMHNLKTGEQKNISRPNTEGGRIDNISGCVYGNTVYFLFGTIPAEGEYRHEWMLATYELGSDADSWTPILADLYPGDLVTSIWMEDGIILLDKSDGKQFYYAKFSDIDENGNFNYKKEENKIGTNLKDDDTMHRLDEFIPFPMDSRYVLGNDLVLIDSESISYFDDFDFTTCQTLFEGDMDNAGRNMSSGIYDGALYIIISQYGTDDIQLMKITEGGNTEFFMLDIPE